jgi:hypothetical protein
MADFTQEEGTKCSKNHKTCYCDPIFILLDQTSMEKTKKKNIVTKKHPSAQQRLFLPKCLCFPRWTPFCVLCMVDVSKWNIYRKAGCYLRGVTKCLRISECLQIFIASEPHSHYNVNQRGTELTQGLSIRKSGGSLEHWHFKEDGLQPSSFLRSVTHQQTDPVSGAFAVYDVVLPRRAYDLNKHTLILDITVTPLY